MNKKQALALQKKRTDIVKSLSLRLENKVKESEAVLFKEVIQGFVDELDTTDGKIDNSPRNRRLLATIDTIFDRFANTQGVGVAAGIVKGIQEILQFNNQYFSAFEEKTRLVPINNDIKITIEGWLGMDPEGKIQQNGYLSNLIQDTTVRNNIKDIMIRSIVGGNGYNETKNFLKKTIVGDKENLGAMQKYYRNFVYDTFSQVDRTASKITADKLKLNYAIYEGGLIETSRPFCIERNGEVFSREEISKFDPPTAKQPNYNPFVDLGGFGCRHHLNWIPDSLAFILRPGLKK